MSISANAIDINTQKTSTLQNHQLGLRYENDRGEVFRYAKVGASTISRGKLQTAPAPKTNHHNMAVAAAVALGDKTITVTLGATAAVADEYAEGFIVFNDAALGAHQYRIKTHPAASSAANLTVTLYAPVSVVALTTSSKANLVHNAWNGVIEGTSQTVRAAGVAGIGATTGQYLWLKTKGIAAVLADQTIALGSTIVVGNSVAGSVLAINSTYGTGLITVPVGRASVMAGVDTEYRPMELTID